MVELVDIRDLKSLGIKFCTSSSLVPTTIVIEDGKPCWHKGCRFHTLHPCEVCGRILMNGKVFLEVYINNLKERRVKDAKINE